MSGPDSACPFCGGPPVAELLEAWGDHRFMIDSCCEAAGEWLVDSLDDRSVARELFNAAGLPGLRRVVDTGVELLADWAPEVRPIRWADAKRFVAEHHRHCPRSPAGWRFGAGIFNGSTLLGVIMVGRPSARLIDPSETCEVTRLCLDLGIDQGLRWNATSTLLGWVAKQCRARGFRRLITYTRADELGCSLKASGWVPTRQSRGGTRSRAGRDRSEHNTVPKIRWERRVSA